MKILFLSTHVPHKNAMAGLQIVYQRMVRFRQRGHEIGLCALSHEGEDPPADPLYDEWLECKTEPAPDRHRSWRALSDYALSRVPPPFWPYHVPALFPKVGEMVKRTRYDVVFAEFCAMGQYLQRNLWLPPVPKVLSTHSCASIATRTPMFLPERTLFGSMKEHIIKRDLRRFEFSIYRAMDRVLTFSRTDQFSLLDYAPDLRVSVVPPGVDFPYFNCQGQSASAPQILFTGQYADPANRDAFMWFIRHTWPRLKTRHPGLTFIVVGPNPSPAMSAAAREQTGVEVLGEIADIRPYLERAKIFVCPMRMGSGLRVKMLEAMAAGVPVVTTSAAAEGIPIHSGVNAMMADDPSIMADAITLILDDPALARRLANNAREMVRARFDWDRSMDTLERILGEVAARA